MSRNRSLAAALAIAVSCLGPGSARAWLETGTLLTNSASATYAWRGYGGSVTYSATMKVLMANPSLFMWKYCSPTVVTTVGGLVTYTISFSNGGAGTAWNVTINDRIDPGISTSWQGHGPTPAGCDADRGYWVGNGGAVYESHSMDGGASWINGPPSFGQQGPFLLRWRVSMLGIGVSGNITYVVSLG